MESKIHSNYVAAARARGATRIRCFLASTNSGSDNPYLNYAVPDNDAAPSPDDVAVLVGHYRSSGRAPRLEYVTAAAPAVEPALLAAGFVVEGRLPLMTCTPSSLDATKEPEGFVLSASGSNADIEAELTVTRLAYGAGGQPTRQEILGRRAFVQRGGLVVVARHRDTGEPAGSGICEVAQNGMSELATVGVVPTFRHSGVAMAVTARLCQEAFRRGIGMLWLTPHDQAHRIYQRVGFEVVGEVLHISLPEAAA